MHEGIVGAHEKARLTIQKIARLGYYWPTMYQDTEDIIYKCEKFQKQAPIPKKSATPTIRISIL